MKIAVASDDGKDVAGHFGRARGFVIVEVEDKEIMRIDYLPNTFTGHARGMHEEEHHHHHGHPEILEALKDVEVVISRGMGRRLFEDLKQAGKKVFVTDVAEVKEAVELFLEGKLQNLEELLH